MTKTLKTALLAGLSLCLLSAPALALDVPEGKAAVIEAILGRVKATVADKQGKPKVGDALDFGDSLQTGSNGRVSLRHADNAVTRIAPNTELTLSPPGKKKGVFLALKTGFIRFLVGHRKPGESFEVQTSNAVAAVKGTDGSVETDGKTTNSAVYSSSRDKAMDFLNKATGEKLTLSPGQTAGLDDKGFNTRELNKDDFAKAEKGLNGLPKPVVQGEGTEGGGAGDGGGKKDEAVSGPGAGGDAIGEAISDAFGAVMDDLGIDNLLERDERTGDLVAGRIAYDRNGDRTQISSYILRASDKTIVKATYSKRETGPFVGTSFAEEATTWNAKLPEDWASVAKRPLTDPANLDSGGYPIFWLYHQDFRAGNPQGDTLQVLRDYEYPVFQEQYGGPYYVRGALLSSQGFSQGLYLNGTAVQYLNWTTNAANYASDPNNATLIGEQPHEYNLIWTTNYPYGNSGPLGGLNSDGSFSLVYSVFDDTDVFLQTDVTVLSQNGQKQDIAALIAAKGDSNIAALDDTYGQHYLRDFRGLNNSLSIELTFRSVYFSAPIDLLVIPEIFNNMDFYDMPVASNGGG